MPVRGIARALCAGLALAALAAAMACDSTPSGPAPFLPGTGGSSRNGTLAGRVVSYGTSTGVPGATVLLAGSAAVTDAQGAFSMSGLPTSGVGAVTVNATNHLFRGMHFNLAPARDGITLDVLAQAAPFSVDFFRAFVRNGHEGFTLQPTARWTVNPNFYFKTIVEGTTTVVDPAVLDRIEANFRVSVPELSAGRLQAGLFERGATTREAVDGWVNVTFYADLGAAFGQSTVGGNTGTMSIRYGMVSNETTNPFGCTTPEVQIADHEITHTMGYWHTPDIFVDTFSGAGCPGIRTDRVKYHAAVNYSRPVGNRDPDIDPSTAVNSTVGSTVPRAVVVCDVWR